MSPRPDPPEVDRVAASRAAVAARRARAAVKHDIATHARTARDVLDAAWADPQLARGGPPRPRAADERPDPRSGSRGQGHDAARHRRIEARRAGSGSGSAPSSGTTCSDREGGIGSRPSRRARRADRRRQGHRLRATSARTTPTSPQRLGDDARRRDPARSTACTTTSSSDAEFDRMIAEHELLEWAIVHNSFRYGTPRPPIDAALDDGPAACCSRSTCRARAACGAAMPERRPGLPAAARPGKNWCAG